MEFASAAVALVGLAVSAILAMRLARLEAKLRAIEARPQPTPLPEPIEVPSPLQGLTIALDIDQDHPHAPFVDLLKDLLMKEDVGELSSGESADITIRGEVRCNGYAEIYYSADLTCSTQRGPVCTLVERPPHGDRPSNLAMELIAKLKREVDRYSTREERRAALRELGA